MKDATLQAALKADAGPLPAFDEKFLLIQLPLPVPVPVSVSVSVSVSVPMPVAEREGPSERRDLKIFWLGPAALAACVALAYLGNRPAVPADGLSASVAAVTDAAQSTTQFAVLPMRPFHQNLTALNDDTQRLARFVTDQLNVLPTPG